jgi:hypothetical protein
MYKALRLWAPDLPIFLAKQLIRDRYRRVAERRIWSGLRGEAEFILNDAKTAGTVTMTRDSASVTGSGTDFQASDVGRQFQVGNRAPVYTVSAVGSTTDLTLDRVWGDETVGAGLSYRILDAYVTCPADFKSFIVVYDPKQNWRLRHNVTQEDIARLDPARTSAGTPWAVVDRRFSTLTATLGRPQYELWPYTTSERNYPYYYQKQVADLTDDSDIPEIPVRGDVLVRGALADVCRWPGSTERPNPMYEPGGRAAKSWEEEFEVGIAELERNDENIYLTWLGTNMWSAWPYAPLDSAFLQNHGF